MSGTSNVTGDESIVFTDNISFDGTERGGKMTTNGQLWIGSTSSRHVKLGNITSPNGTITFGYSSPNITADITGGQVAVEHLTGNTGGQLNPDGSNNFNTIGSGSLTISGSGSTLTTQLTGLTNHAVLVGAGTATITKLGLGTNGQVLLGSTSADPAFATVATNANMNTVLGAASLTLNPYNCAKWIVDPTANIGTHQTIASAITAAASGDTIFIRPGTYTENLTLKAGVSLTAFGSDSSLNGTGNVIIIGTCTLTTAGSVTISGIQLQTNSAALLAVTGTLASVVNLNNCYLNCTNNTGISYTSSNASSAININYCSGNLGTTGIGIYTNTSAGSLVIKESFFSNSGSSLTASTTSAGSVQFYHSGFNCIFSTSSSGAMAIYNCVFDTSSINTAILTAAGTGTQTISHCYFASGTASSLSAGTGTSINATLCTVNSSNTNAITGAGTAILTGISFVGSSHQTNVTTQTGGIGSGLTQGTAPSAGMVGEYISATTTSAGLSNVTIGNLTSMNLTPGIWNISFGGNIQYSVQSNGQSKMGISTANNTLPGNQGDQFNIKSSSVGEVIIPFCISDFRVSISATTTYYLNGFASFGSGTALGVGRISGTRVG